MSTEKQISAVLSAAGNLISSLPIIEELGPNNSKLYHCQWQHEKGIVLCKSVGGQSHARYVWEFKPTIQ